MSRLILFNKPFNVLCQFRDQDGRPVLADHITLPGVYPAGRLDHDSEGLLLLTDDGGLQSRISDPRWKLPKTYWVQVEGDISEAALAALRQGTMLKDGPTLPAEAERIAAPPLWERRPPIRYRASIPTSWIALTLREGRNRQVRRMTAALGFPTLRLVRAAIGPWSIAGLAPGEWREEHLAPAAMTALFGAPATRDVASGARGGKRRLAQPAHRPGAEARPLRNSAATLPKDQPQSPTLPPNARLPRRR